MNAEETERAELIAALHQAATFAEGLLDLNERLLDALTTGAIGQTSKNWNICEPACHGGASTWPRCGSAS
jgi:hypothetical protein